MKKGVLIFSFVLITILLVSSVYAFSWRDFWGGISGRTITGNAIRTTFCEDSDDGLNYDVNGTVKYRRYYALKYNYVSDSCSDELTLREYYCNKRDLDSKEYNCEYGCEDGACLPKPSSGGGGGGCIAETCSSLGKECGDFDDGCGGILNCGTCEELSTCTDSDDGKDYYVKGNVTIIHFNNSTTGYIDCCAEDCNPTITDTNALVEMYCKKFPEEIDVVYSCPNGCSDGACIEGANQEKKECLVHSDCPGGYLCNNLSKCVLTDCICPEIWEPVCSVNEKTYSNSCFAECDNAKIVYNAECFGLFDFNIIDLVASNSPEEYLGDYIYQEFYSDWKNYPPLVNKVKELTKDLNNDYDKAVAIGNWVRNSRPYDEEASIKCGANNLSTTITEIFDCYAGICLDAAVINTAMLRIAGIPARVILPRGGIFHGYSEAYVNKRWVGFDSVFSSGQNVSIFNITSPVSTSFQTESENILIFINRLTQDTERIEIKEIGGEDFNLINVTYFEDKHITKENFGYLYYPWSRELLTYTYIEEENLCVNWGLNFEERRLAGTSIYLVGLLESFECSYYNCGDIGTIWANDEAREKNKGVSLIAPKYYKGLLIDEKAGIDILAAYLDVQRVYPTYSGYFRTTLPAGNYTLFYSMNTNCGFYEGEIRRTAVYEFSIKEGESTVIKPEMLLKEEHPKTSQEEFDIFIKFLETNLELTRKNQSSQDEVENEQEPEIEQGETPLIPCQGCLIEEKCYHFGYREDGKFCSANSNEFILQKQAGESCDNNFECSTNLCIDGECISSGFWQKIMGWFRHLFGS